jgi:hypothetical protein
MTKYYEEQKEDTYKAAKCRALEQKARESHITSQNSLGDCNCIKRDHKLLILRVFKEAIENQKDIINKTESHSEDIARIGMNKGQMIDSSRNFMRKLETTRNAIKDIPDCKQDTY